MPTTSSRLLSTLLFVLLGAVSSALAGSFEVVFVNNRGWYPRGSVVQGSDGNFYGTTYDGGRNYSGTVYRITPAGTITILHHFDGINGGYPSAGLLLANDGNFYGTTLQGGASNYGTVFKITPSGVHTLLHSFSNTLGSYPRAGLVQGSDGSFYGTTANGGASGYGTVFKITASGTHTLLHSFNGTNGSSPYAGLVQGSDGNFYGTTVNGGASGVGTLFKVTPGGAHTLLHTFNNTNGSFPQAGLVKSSDGSFYGTTVNGGASGYGTVFRITDSGTHTLLHSFNHTLGSNPHADLVQGSDGSFYGATASGGASISGTLFKITSTGTHTLLHSFNLANGSNPQTGLFQSSDGNFYGTTYSGGALGGGTLFRTNSSGATTVLHNFDNSAGRTPLAGLTLVNDGSFFGTASEGGSSGFGSVFRVTSSGSLTTLQSLSESIGVYPQSELIEGIDGNYYGTASSGGAYGDGTVFRITPFGNFSTIYSFNYPSGAYPYGELTVGKDGYFYGSTAVGGDYEYGTLFRLSPTGTATTLHHFDGYNNGSSPKGGLVLGSDGNFYGTTSSGTREEGGSNYFGTIFKVTPSGTLATLHAFDQTNGSFPAAKMIKGSDGHLYGTTKGGGAYNYGTVFKISPSGVFEMLYSFDGTHGSSPSGGLVISRDGMYYGTTSEGGAYNADTVYQITPAGTLTTLHDFDGASAYRPAGTPVFGMDGNLYGVASPLVVWRLRWPTPVVLANKGSGVPGAGVVGSGVPADAVWNKLGIPAVAETGQIAVLGEWKVGRALGAGLFYQPNGNDPLSLLLAKGAAVPGIPNAVFSAFADPLLSGDGALVCRASLANAPGNTTAVKTSSNAAILLDADGAGANPAVVIARKGNVAAGTTSAKWESFDSIAVSDGAVAFLAKLVASTADGVTTASNQGLWLYNRGTGVTSLLMRKNDSLLSSKVSVISALTTRTKAGGQGRGVVSNSGEHQIALRVTLMNGKTAVGVISSTGGATFPYVSNGLANGFGSGALWQTLGTPGQNAPAGAICFLGTVKAGTGTATSSNNVALFSEDDATLTLTKRFAINTYAGIGGGLFSGFSDPVNGSNGAMAFLGSMAANAAAGITSSSNDGVWYFDGTQLILVAREGTQPPGITAGARWKSFSTVAIPEGRGPIFVASLVPGRGGITAAKDTGLWAVDSAGTVKKLLQEGDPIGNSRVVSFKVLSVVPGSPAQTRSFNSDGDVVMQVTDAAGGTYLVRVTVP
jgi:uncharacterized repeat protein (TIGR03803 family)